MSDAAIETPEVEVKKHKPTLKWVNMVVANEKAKGRKTQRQLAEYKRNLRAKHGV